MNKYLPLFTHVIFTYKVSKKKKKTLTLALRRRSIVFRLKRKTLVKILRNDLYS